MPRPDAPKSKPDDEEKKPAEPEEEKPKPEGKAKQPPAPKQGKALSGSKDPGSDTEHTNPSRSERFRARLHRDGAKGKADAEMTRFGWIRQRFSRHREE